MAGADPTRTVESLESSCTGHFTFTMSSGFHCLLKNAWRGAAKLSPVSQFLRPQHPSMRGYDACPRESVQSQFARSDGTDHGEPRAPSGSAASSAALRGPVGTRHGALLGSGEAFAAGSDPPGLCIVGLAPIRSRPCRPAPSGASLLAGRLDRRRDRQPDDPIVAGGGSSDRHRQLPRGTPRCGADRTPYRPAASLSAPGRLSSSS